MNNFAMWIGYIVMVLCTFAALGALMAILMNSIWRDLVNAYSLDYMATAVAHYKTIKPPPSALEDDGPEEGKS